VASDLLMKIISKTQRPREISMAASQAIVIHDTARRDGDPSAGVAPARDAGQASTLPPAHPENLLHV